MAFPILGCSESTAQTANADFDELAAEWLAARGHRSFSSFFSAADHPHTALRTIMEDDLLRAHLLRPASEVHFDAKFEPRLAHREIEMYLTLTIRGQAIPYRKAPRLSDHFTQAHSPARVLAYANRLAYRPTHALPAPVIPAITVAPTEWEKAFQEMKSASATIPGDQPRWFTVNARSQDKENSHMLAAALLIKPGEPLQALRVVTVEGLHEDRVTQVFWEKLSSHFVTEPAADLRVHLPLQAAWPEQDDTTQAMVQDVNCARYAGLARRALTELIETQPALMAQGGPDRIEAALCTLLPEYYTDTATEPLARPSEATRWRDTMTHRWNVDRAAMFDLCRGRPMDLCEKPAFVDIGRHQVVPFGNGRVHFSAPGDGLVR